jgi:hypothetical protein
MYVRVSLPVSRSQKNATSDAIIESISKITRNSLRLLTTSLSSKYLNAERYAHAAADAECGEALAAAATL